MACFERASPALKEILLKIHGAERPMEVDHHLHEFGSVHYHVQCSASDPVYTYISISTPLLSRGLPLSSELPKHTLEMVKNICPNVMETMEPLKEGFQLTLKLNLSRIPHSKASTKTITDISSVQAVILSSQLKEILKNVDSHEISRGIYKPIKLVYHPREPFFVIKQPTKIAAIFPMRFKEPEDVIIATAFLQELMDVGSSKACAKAPHCTWSPIPPPELRGEPIEDLSTNCGFVSFDIMSRHVKGKKLDKTVWNLLNFYAFVKYHVKSTRGFIQRRMRMRLDRLVQPLKNVEIEEDQPMKTTAKGCTPMSKWISASKSKIAERKHEFTKKIKRLRSRIKIHGFGRFRRRWLKIPRFSPVTRYMKLE
ncbi:Actin-related protein Arp2/3 complex, subunit ARPC2 [Handroanthus impetiginosus]|uniref:Arp2/3 complex 34 kDa subunit n=1 Tax=Handroanthus impetiginosus TaxID=429701 RepID=A0A2G9HK66_9LAMI|nr:Actin-related protein Arp2/3 complex, subunit ARPC2 [Handroanthus impetiginosus]